LSFKIIAEKLNGIKIIEYDKYSDNRGYFMETFRQDVFNEFRLPFRFIQDNISKSRKNVIRGLHFQWDPPMGKLVSVLKGKAFLVGVDIRKNSPSLGNWHGIELKADSNQSIYYPPGFAFGFCALGENTLVQYKCTAIFNPKTTSEILWNDEELGIKWPVKKPIISEKDNSAQSFTKWINSPESENFKHHKRQ